VIAAEQLMKEALTLLPGKTLDSSSQVQKTSDTKEELKQKN
jgi:hypothetical protein